MRGLVLAGGYGTRLKPLTNVTNKHLLPIGRHVMLYHPIKALIESGIDNIMIVSGVDHVGDMIETFGSGRKYGAQFTYRVQDEAGGIAQAISLAKDFVGKDNVAVILGDNMFDFKLDKEVLSFDEDKTEKCRLFLKRVDDPKRFGVAEVLSDDKILYIEEKPKVPKSDLAVIGIYFYSSDVFSKITSLKPSGRGELEVTDLNMAYVKNGVAEAKVIDGYWSDAGTFETYRSANRFIWEKYDGSFY